MENVNNNKLLVFVSMVFAGAIFAGCTAVSPKDVNGYYRQKVVYHFNNLDSAYLGLRNIDNHLNAVGDKDVEIIAVAHAGGAYMLVDGAQDKKGRTFNSYIAKLSDRGVKFQICANTIRNKKIPKDKINLHAMTVPSGAAQIVHLQQEGYIYVKP